MPTIELLSVEEAREVALDLVSGRVLIADLERPEWQIALALMADSISEYDNTGLILVPVADHMAMPWQGSIAPGCVVKCSVVPRESIPLIEAAIAVLTGEVVERKINERMEYVSYVSECETEGLDAHSFDMWLVHGKPKGPLG